MNIECIGGPYDGQKIQAIDLERYVPVMVIEAGGLKRRFVYLPEPADWPAVLSGRKRVDDSAAVHYYELVGTTQGIRLVHDADRQHFWETMNQAIREMSNRNGELRTDGPAEP